MKIPLFQVDAFANAPFEGNPAAVCLLESMLEDEVLQNIASEINLSETAFLVKSGLGGYDLRWFTPVKEVSLCGHATLASAHILYNEAGVKEEITFHTLSGALEVTKTGMDIYEMKFPIDEAKPLYLKEIFDDVGFEFQSVFEGKDDYLLVLKDQKAVQEAKPNFAEIAKFGKRGLIITAAGDHYDFVSRCFYPSYGVDEDPVTGSAHTLLANYWCKRKGKNHFSAKQLSKRTGTLTCRVNNEHVFLIGKAKTIIRGYMYL